MKAAALERSAVAQLTEELKREDGARKTAKAEKRHLKEEKARAKTEKKARKKAGKTAAAETASVPEPETFAPGGGPEDFEFEIPARTANLPTLDQLRGELKRERGKHQYGRTMRSTLYALVVVAAVAVLVATLWLPVLKIYGTSMTETLYEDDVVVSLKGSEFRTGDVIAFYYENKLLVKRCIAGPGEWVDIDKEGNVYVNNELIDEPYISEKAYGDCNIDLPYQVPDGRYFVMGDHRATSADSRSSVIGCVAEEQVVGKIVFRVWPLSEFGMIE